jgi:hypothetical protein
VVHVLEIALPALIVAATPAWSSAAEPAMPTGLEALPETETLGPPLQPRSAETRRIFVNFDGAFLRYGERDDATRDITRASALVGERAAYGGSTTERLAIVQAVRGDFEPFNVAVTGNRPASGDYVMAVVGANRPSGEYWDSLLGSAFLDCWDAQTSNDVSFAFHDAEAGRAASAVARTISQEVAHGFGLEHVDDPLDVMYPSSHSGDPSFVDDCNAVVPAAGIGIACTTQHVEVCGTPDRQNSYRELLMILGPALPDSLAPAVEFEQPLDGMEFELGSAVPVRALADDDGAIDRLVLYKDGEPVAEDLEAPFEWFVNEDDIGAVEYTVEAYDLSGNVALSRPVTVFVGMEAPMRGNAGYDEALACNAAGRTEPRLLLLLLALVGLVRRRGY